MLALIAGTGNLPTAIFNALDEKPLVCALAGFMPKVDVDLVFRLETLGSFLATLKERGVTDICLAGAIRRPVIDPSAIDAATLPLVPQIKAALGAGDDGALRVVIKLMEDMGFIVAGAHEFLPDVLPASGIPTKSKPAEYHRYDAIVGEACIAELGKGDIGQACVVRIGSVVAKEDVDGTAVMLRLFHENFERPLNEGELQFALNGYRSLFPNVEPEAITADDGILFKAPKPNQDRRADLPLIGIETAMQAAEAGLAGIVIDSGGVMVLEIESIVELFDRFGMFLWVREKGEQ